MSKARTAPTRSFKWTDLGPTLPELPEVSRKLFAADHEAAAAALAAAGEFMDDPEFHKRDTVRSLFAADNGIPVADSSWYLTATAGLGESRQMSPAPTPMLTARQERSIFRQFNFARFQLARLREKHLSRRMTDKQVRIALLWSDVAKYLREQIAEFNLPLVLAMIKHIGMRNNVDRNELIGEGNMALMCAIDKFRVDRGFKFSTYACRSILTAFGRTGKKMTRQQRVFPVSFDAEMDEIDPHNDEQDVAERDQQNRMRQVLQRNEANLSEIERTILRHRFPLDENRDGEPMTLVEVGNKIGFTKERVRQIQMKALEKLRHCMEQNLVAAGVDEDHF